MNIIILTTEDQIKDNTFKINDERAIHIQNVLKSDIGDILEIGLLNGPKGKAKVVELQDSEVKLEIVNFEKTEEEPQKLELVCALPRPQTLKKILSTCATMGVTKLFLIRSEKVEKSYFHSPLLNEEKYNKYLIEGLSQGKRTTLPKVIIHKKFKEFFNDNFTETFRNSTCLIAHPDDNNYLNHSLVNRSTNLLLAIGPEGGWNDFEVSLMQEKGFTKFKLSESILRVETAVTAALAHIEIMRHNNL